MSTKEDIFTYIMNTPGNTNPAVLESLLDNLEDSSESIPPHNIVNITNNSSGTPGITGSGLITSDGVSSSDLELISIPSGTSKMFLYNTLLHNGYRSEFLIASQSDLYSVDLNGATIAYSSFDGGYFLTMNSPTAPITGQTYNVVITDKE